jgi:hypothetical protein
MENTTAVERRPSDLELKNILLLRRHRNGKTRHTNRPFMIVQSIDKLPVAFQTSGMSVTCIWFSSDLKLQKSRFSTKDIIKKTSQ